MAKLVGRLAQPGAPGQAANRPPRRPHTLLISVAHGDLRLAKYPLAVGHYHGDTIVHAEARLDRQLNGRLTELFNLYLYPGPPGTVEVVHVPGAKPPGALIIGLGDVGDLKPSIVRNGVSNAALRHALAVLNEARSRGFAATAANGNGNGMPARTWMPAGFSTLLLGTYGGNALNIGASLSAIVQGVTQANEALRAQGLWDKVRIDEVQIVEIYEDVALEATRAAVYLAEHPPSYLVEGDALQAEPPYMFPLGKGRTQRPMDPYSRGWWRRIQVTSEKGKDGEDGLRFLALTDRARAEDTLQHTQRKFIESAIERAVASPGYAEDLATMLFKLLIPNSLKDQSISETDLVLVLDSESAQYPWELLAERTRNGVEPLAVRIGIVRQFKTANFALNPQPARDMTALVVGVPKSKEISLPGARQEAEEVAKVLDAAGYDVGGGPLNDAGPLEIMGRLFAKGYKILHLAGHGTYVPGKPAESGMILDEGMLLTSMELRNLNPLPELVFINCCHLGRIDEQELSPTNSPHALAASISEELIKSGVKAVVAAGWAVNDAAAVAFARVFYQEMLRGQKFGDSVKAARIAARIAAGNSNTWGAYQCYGNPDFVLERAGDGSESARNETRCYSRREYLEKLTDLKADAARADAAGRSVLRTQLEEIDRDLPGIWRDGAIMRAFGDAWAELGSFDKAIENYRAAADDEKAEAPLNTVEQLANMLCRYADDLRLRERRSHAAEENGAGTLPTPGVLMDEAFQRLEWLFKLGETTERLSLMGSYYKRKAAAAQDSAERVAALESAKTYYFKAHQLYKDKLGVIKPYPALNWLTYRFLLGEPLDADLSIIEESKEAARKENENEPTFWSRVTEADAELLLRLTKDDLEETLDSVIAMYRTTFESGSTPRERASVIHHFDFLQEMLSGLKEQHPAQEKNLRSLEILRVTFGSLCQDG